MEEERIAREGYDMVLAQNITHLRNALVEKGVLGPEHRSDFDKNTIFSTCIVCNQICPTLREEYDDLHSKMSLLEKTIQEDKKEREQLLREEHDDIHSKISLLEKTIQDERRERQQLDVILAQKIADLTNERNVLIYTTEIDKVQAHSILYNCVICSKEKRNTVILPCAHVVTCKSCTADIMKDSKKCPVCNMEVRHVMWP